MPTDDAHDWRTGGPQPLRTDWPPMIEFGSPWYETFDVAGDAISSLSVDGVALEPG